MLAHRLLTSNAMGRPGYRGQPPRVDGLAAIETDSIISRGEPIQCGVYLLQGPIASPLDLQGNELIMCRLSLVVFRESSRIAEARDLRAHFREQFRSFGKQELAVLGQFEFRT